MAKRKKNSKNGTPMDRFVDAFKEFPIEERPVVLAVLQQIHRLDGGGTPTKVEQQMIPALAEAMGGE